jgi:hypothetical protein
MIRGPSTAPLAPALALMLSSCAFILDFDELSEGGGGAAGSGGSGGSAGAPIAIPLEDAPAALAAALCGRLEACVGAAAMEVLFFDEECTVVSESNLANTVVANVAQSQEAGTLAYDASRLPGCLEAYANLPCEEVLLGFPEECWQTLGGLLAEGEDCAHSLECEADLYCSADACPGSCSAPLAQGDACGAADVCATGLTCFEGACAPLAGEGEECGGDVLPDCVTGFVCLNEDKPMMMPGECFSATDVFVLSEGQACNLGETPALCQVGLSCPLVVGAKCVESVASGGPCNLAVPDMCPQGEVCVFGNPKCQPLPGAGEPCAMGIILKPRCQAYLRCVNEVCRPLGDNGDPCGVGDECYSGVCTGGECVPSACQ